MATAASHPEKPPPGPHSTVNMPGESNTDHPELLYRHRKGKHASTFPGCHQWKSISFLVCLPIHSLSLSSSLCPSLFLSLNLPPGFFFPRKTFSKTEKKKKVPDLRIGSHPENLWFMKQAFEVWFLRIDALSLNTEHAHWLQGPWQSLRNNWDICVWARSPYTGNLL